MITSLFKYTLRVSNYISFQLIINDLRVYFNKSPMFKNLSYFIVLQLFVSLNECKDKPFFPISQITSDKKI